MMTLPVIYNRKLLALMTSVSLLTAAPMQAFAQAASDYPSRPIELVVPFGAGGGTDILARVTAEAAKKHSSQPITVVNRPGASGSIGLTEGAAAVPGSAPANAGSARAPIALAAVVGNACNCAKAGRLKTRQAAVASALSAEKGRRTRG
jgi:tripartite-type tricarboxylate transporter receptor subunit TctC